MESHRQTEDRAAAFLARRDSGDWVEEDQAELEQWLAESTARRVSFLRLEAAWEEARRLKALSAGLTAGTVPPAGEWRHTPFFNSESVQPRDGLMMPQVPEPSSADCGAAPPAKRLRLFAFAATVVLALGMGVYFRSSPSGERFSTPIGGIASVPLADGSLITLNTETHVRVELSPQERHIRLDRGEAFFEVAHDPTRPFVVQVGNKRVIAVGTKFSVRREGEDIRVVVTEGKVRIETGATGGAKAYHQLAAARGLQSTGGARTEKSREGGGPGEVFVTPGGIASASDGGIVVERMPLNDAEADLSWRQGYLTFHDTSLSDAVAEFNRYNVHKIAIDEPTVAAIRISGTFRTLNYEAFVRVLDEGFAIHARNTDNLTILAR